MDKKNSKKPDPLQLKKLAEKLVREQSAMTVATARGGASWAAPVYFVFHGACFYFFSSPESRHIQESMESGCASAAIHPEVSTWQEIRGIQMDGRIEAVLKNLEAVAVIAKYLKKFSFTRQFFNQDQPFTMETFSERFKVGLYKFTPGTMYYLDNSIDFGFRGVVILH